MSSFHTLPWRRCEEISTVMIKRQKLLTTSHPQSLFLIHLTCTVPLTRFPDLVQPCPAKSKPQYFSVSPIFSSVLLLLLLTPFSPISTCVHFFISCPHPLLPRNIDSSTFSISLSTASNLVLPISTALPLKLYC